MNPTSGIYWVDLNFINIYKKFQLWQVVILRYNVNVVSVFHWVFTYKSMLDGLKFNNYAISLIHYSGKAFAPLSIPASNEAPKCLGFQVAQVAESSILSLN